MRRPATPTSRCPGFWCLMTPSTKHCCLHLTDDGTTPSDYITKTFCFQRQVWCHRLFSVLASVVIPSADEVVWLSLRVTEPETEGARAQAVCMLPLCLHSPHPTPAWWLGSLLHDNCLVTHPQKSVYLGTQGTSWGRGTEEYSPPPPRVLEMCLISTHKFREGKVLLWLGNEELWCVTGN